MAAQLRKVFEERNKLNQPTFVTFVTAGFPNVDKAVDIMLGLQAGGADVIELGIPFTDPIADGAAIQYANTISVENKVDLSTCFDYVKQARAKGLTIPVLFMGYYNPILQYGEELAVQHCREAGANGFIVVDLPPEEAVKFRTICTKQGMSYVPLIAPSTTDSRMEFLGSIADSFIYVVSKMGTTGSSDKVSTSLPSLLERIKKHVPKSIPLAVGFGISNSDHFLEVGNQADGAVIGSKIVTILTEEKNPDNYASAVQQFCQSICGGPQNRICRTTKATTTTTTAAQEPSVDKVINEPSKSILDEQNQNENVKKLPPRFGEFGGQYVPEALYDCLIELEECHRNAMADPEFTKEFRSHYDYINRPSQLYLAKRLTQHAGGAQIYLKREDLNHTGSHKINNAIGQILLAKRIGKTRIIAETGAGQHGVATATACAKFGLDCVVYMGAEDVRRQALNVFRMRMLGAQVISVATGTQTLKDAINEAMKDWVTNLANTHYLVGSAIGPHPFPTIVRDFQRVIGDEIKFQLKQAIGKELPDAVVACVGGGSNAIGTFYPFVQEKSVRLVGVEAGGDGVDTDKHSATLTKGTKGVLHGVKTYLLQTEKGQISGTHSISAGLDYPGVGPEHSYLKDSGRAEYIVADDAQALTGFRLCTQYEGIIPALESAHAVYGAVELAKTLSKDQVVVMCLSGRGDKDVEQISDLLPTYADKINWHIPQ